MPPSTLSPAASRAFSSSVSWINASGGELANYGLFVTELCAALDLPPPDPASEDTRDNAYVFQRRVKFSHGDGEESLGFIDLYRRGAFVLEAKKLRKTGIDEDAIAARFTGRGAWKKRLPQLLEALVTLGRVRKVRGGYIAGT